MGMQIIYISGKASYAQQLFRTQPLDFLQHFAICPGDVTKELEALAKMMDFDYYYIGE